MKKSLKHQILALLLAALMVLGLAVPAFAAEDIYVNEKTTITLYSGKDTYKAGGAKRIQNKNYLSSCRGTVQNLKSSKPSVVGVKVLKNSGWNYIYLYAKKTGTSTVSFSVGGKKYQTKVTVKKYVCPLKSVTVGSKKYTASTFKNRSVLNLKYSDFANKNTRVKVSAKDGWTLISVEYVKNGWMKSEAFGNGKTVKVDGGKGFLFSMYFVNTATGQTENIVIPLK